MNPYVWVFDQDGSNSKRKSPTNIFVENDIYTIERDSGDRDLYLEHGFQELEDKFTRVRNLAFNRKIWPDAEQMAWLFGFVASVQIRTQASRDHHRQQWANIRKRMEVQQQQDGTVSAAKRKAFELISSPSSRGPERGITIEDVRAMEEQPIQNMVGPVITAAMGAFDRMHVAVLCTDDPTGFITSDQPCTWFDPEGYKLPPIYRNPGLANRTIEVTLPISPRQCLIITHSPDYSGYIDVPQCVVDELNRRHIGHCKDNFISCRQGTKPVWFEQRPMPEDSWEMERERKVASGGWPAEPAM